MLTLGKAVATFNPGDFTDSVPRPVFEVISRSGPVLSVNGRTGHVTVLPDTYSTRDGLISALSLGLARDTGTLLFADGLTYAWSAGANVLPGLPNLVPAGPATFRHFGALGNGAANDNAAINAARGLPYKIDGEGKVFGVSGKISALSNTWWERGTFKQLAPGASQSVITLEASGVNNQRWVRMAVDRNGNGQNAGGNAVPNGALGTARGININGGTGHHFEDIEVTGNDSGTACLVTGLDRSSRILRCYIHDIFGVVPLATDDVVQGLSLQSCSYMTVSGVRIERLGWKNAGGDAVTYDNSRGLTLSGCVNINLPDCVISQIGQGIDFSGDLSGGNIACNLYAPRVENCATWGVKFANLTKLCGIFGGHAKLCLLAGLVDSSSFDTVISNTDANFAIGFVSISCGNGIGTNGGFLQLLGIRAYQNYTKLIRCRAKDERVTPVMTFGFFNEKPPAANGARAEMSDCISEGHVLTPARGYTNLLARDPANALLNAEFENGTADWYLDGFEIVLDAANAATGNWLSRCADVSGGNKSMTSQSTVPVKPGDRVYAAASVKTDATVTIANLQTRIIWLNKSGTAIGVATAANITTAQAAYVTSLIIGTAPSGAFAASMQVLCSKTLGTVYVDSASLARVHEELIPSLVSPPKYNHSPVATQGPGYAADTFVLGSNVQIGSAFPKAGTRYRCTISIDKTAVSVAAPVLTLRYGVNGNASDAAVGTFTFAVQPASAVNGSIEVSAVFRLVGTGASAFIVGQAVLSYDGGSAGIRRLASTGFDSEVAGAYLSLSLDAGAMAAWTSYLCLPSLENLV